MSARELFWERVNAALDAGRDPLGDAAVQDGLAAEPELLAEVARLRERLEALVGVADVADPSFRELVDEALDARLDPLDDARVQARLSEAPELLVELATMRARLADVARRERELGKNVALRGAKPVPPLERRGSRRVAAALAALVLVSASAWLVRRGAGTEPPVPVAPPAFGDARDIATRSCVLSCTVEIVTERPDGRTVTMFDGRDTVRSSRSSTAAHGLSDPFRSVAIVESFSTWR